MFPSQPVCHLAALAAVSSLLLLAPLAASAQEQPWMVKPTKEHELLKKDVGSWDAVIKVWPMEGTQPMESKGTETNELMQGGLWLVSRFHGDVAGMPFVGHGISGYDPEKKKYVGTWVDSMTPHLMLTKLEYDEDSTTLSGIAEGYDQHMGKPYEAKLNVRYVDEDKRIFEMHMPDEKGGHWKMLEITYERQAE